jgi:hypothetical protein
MDRTYGFKGIIEGFSHWGNLQVMPYFLGSLVFRYLRVKKTRIGISDKVFVQFGCFDVVQSKKQVVLVLAMKGISQT